MPRSEFTTFSLSPLAFPSAIVPRIELTDSAEAVAAFCARSKAHSAIKGFRQLLNFTSDQPGLNFCQSSNLLSQASTSGVLSILEVSGFHFELQIWPEQAESCAEILSKHPSLPVVVNHCGMPRSGSKADFAAWRGGLEKLAKLAHIYIKISGLAMTVPTVTVDSFQPYVNTIVSLFGTNRCMVGSNFPVDKVVCPDYSKLINTYRCCLQTLPESQQREALYLSALKFYRLEQLTAEPE